jgi:hypothetical protein
VAVHIKNIIELLDCIKEAKKMLNGLAGDSAISLSSISKWQNKTDNLLKEVKNGREK